jgi:hypothetical protein
MTSWKDGKYSYWNEEKRHFVFKPEFLDPTFKDHQEDLIEQYKKGNLMNESINQSMAAVQQEAEQVNRPTPEQDKYISGVKEEIRPGQEVFYQTEDQVGTETKETRIN